MILSTFDANILVYTLRVPANAKATEARDLLLRGARNASIAFLLQSLNEFSYVALRKLRMDVAIVRRRVAALLRIAAPIHSPSEQDLVNALDLIRDHRLSFWDALMCTTAGRAGLRYLLTEDLQDGLRLGNLTIVNPFRPENTALIERILPA